MVTARRAAVKALGAWRRDGAWSGAYLDGLIKSEKMAGREAALAQRLTLGVLQHLYLCDFYVQHFSSQKLKKIEPVVLDILRVGAYQILFLDRVPDFSAVDESVELTKKLANPRAAGFVNALLRRIAAEKDSLPQPVGAETERLSVLYSHPQWLVGRFLEQIGEEETEKLLALYNSPAPLTIQANPLRCVPETLFAELGAVGGAFPDAAVLENTGNPEKMPGFMDGAFFVQDLSARCAVEAAAPKPGMRVLDLCAAPGGKSFMAAIKMENRGEIRAFDLYENKLPRIREGAKRLGLRNIQIAQGDAAAHKAELDGWADIVLADVPCSGLGIIRKKPEIRYKTAESLRGLPEIQKNILQNSGAYVRPGGCLLYSTCTLLPEENQGVVEAFLRESSSFAPEDFLLPAPYGASRNGQMTLWPQRCGSDGFFIAKLRKKA